MAASSSTRIGHFNVSDQMDIFFYEAFQDEANTLKSLMGSECKYGFTFETVQETGHKNPPARLISIRTQSVVPPEWASRLDGVLSRSTGYDHLIAYAAKIQRKLPLGYLEEYATRAVAEHALMVTMALLRKLPQQIKQFPVFNRENLTGFQCAGKNLLVVGVGRIGSEIARLSKGLGFNVRGVDIVPDKTDVTYVSKEEGIRAADVIVSAMNLTDENRGYFDYELFRTAKKGAVFVNIARGELSPLGDLERALSESILSGVGLDVFEEEGALGAALRSQGTMSSPQVRLVRRILAFPNVVLTPHNAFNSIEALRRKSELSVKQIRHFLKHGDFLWKV